MLTLLTFSPEHSGDNNEKFLIQASVTTFTQGQTFSSYLKKQQQKPAIND